MDWLRKPRGSAVWSVAAVLVGIVSLREFVSGWRVLLQWEMGALWLAFGLINPWFEEAYWRGLIIDAAGRCPLAGVVYAAVAFAVSHPLVWGVHSVPLRHPAAVVGLGFVGFVWGLAYWRTRSLRGPSLGTRLPTFWGYRCRSCSICTYRWALGEVFHYVAEQADASDEAQGGTRTAS
jgi:membrane protease YdiL (CAAX protease family)